jgi:arsenate reductase
MNKTRVLFLCTGNSARSQMAEAFLRRYGGERFEVHSAGLEPALGIHPLALKVMQEIGFDMQGHYAKDISDYLGRVHFGYLITVCDRAEQNCPIFPGVGRRLHWGFEDPAAFEGSEEQKLAKFREVRDQIEARIKTWLQEIG